MDVTQQHEARAALQAAFEQIKAEQTELRRMTDAVASYIYVLRPDGAALYANQTVLDYTGLTLEDVQREDQRTRVFHPEDLERLREERQEGFARGKPFELEQRALGKDGNYRWFLVRFNPLRDDHGTLFAGMPLGRILRIASEPRKGCVTKTLRSGSNRFCVHVRGDCGSVSSLAKRALEHRQSGPNRFHGAHHRRKPAQGKN